MSLLLRRARFPDLKTLDLLDWDVLREIERPQLDQMATCESTECGEDIVDDLNVGPICTGKIHLAIGVEGVQRGQRVVLVRAADLVRGLVEALDEHTLARLHQSCLRVALLIV